MLHSDSDDAKLLTVTVTMRSCLHSELLHGVTMRAASLLTVRGCQATVALGSCLNRELLHSGAAMQPAYRAGLHSDSGSGKLLTQ